MSLILWAFALFHACVSAASLGMAVRLLTAEERALWRSKSALLVAELMCWVYPIVAFVGVRAAWAALEQGHHLGVPYLVSPLIWLVVMGAVFAIVDFAEDGVLGNARLRD